jgi:circadian clock protein KaiC
MGRIDNLTDRSRIPTGVAGLDEILHGGLIPARTYLVFGGPGTGKTTIGLHFLAAGGSGLFISFGEPEQSIRTNAQSLGFDLGRISFLDLSPTGDSFRKVAIYDIFSPAEVEREPVTREVTRQIDEVKPERVFVDCFGQMRYLAADRFHFHRLAQSFFRLVTDQGATLVITHDSGDDLRSLADGVIHLEHGRGGRRLLVSKLRGSSFHPGPHPMRLTDSGVQVLPNVA